MVLPLKRRKSRAPPGPPNPLPSLPALNGQVFRPTIAGWSSPVARQAHNLKVVGSNPTPATKSNLVAQPRHRKSPSAQRLPSLDARRLASGSGFHDRADFGHCDRGMAKWKPSFAVPSEADRLPAVFLLMDTPGIREELRDMARRVATTRRRGRSVRPGRSQKYAETYTLP